MEASTEVDFLILSDYGEVVGGKLYLMGGAWDRITVRDATQPMRFAVTLGVVVPWNATNQTHTLRISLQDADAVEHGVLVESSFVAGRPPELKPGSSQRVLLAVNWLGAPPPAGEYTLVATINGEEGRRVGFTVLYV